MNNYEQLINKQSKLAVIGLGHVGMPIAARFAKKVDVIDVKSIVGKNDYCIDRYIVWRLLIS